MLRKPKKPLEEAPDSWLKRWKQGFIQLAASFGDWYYGLYNRAYQEIIRLLPVKQRVLWLDKPLFALGVYASSIAKNQRLMLTILLCTEIMPSLIVATALFVDVYYLGKFQYFYVSLYLMIILVTWKVLLAMLKEIAENTLKNIAKYVCFKPIDPANPEGEWSWFASDEGLEHAEIYATYDRRSRIILLNLDRTNKVREEFHILFISARLLTGLFYASSWCLVVYKIWVF